MNTLLAQLHYRIKAVLTGTFVALVGVAEWLVQNPDTQTAIQSVIQAVFPPEVAAVLTQFVPVVIGAIGTALVHQVPLGEKPAKPDDTPPVTELTDDASTTMIPVQPDTSH